MRPPRSILLLALLLAAPAGARAYQVRLGDGTNTLVLAAGETLEREALLLAQGVEIRGSAAQDLWLAASEAVRFDGACRGDLRILSRSTVLAGEVRRNLAAYAAGLQLTTGSVVRGDTVLFGNTVICEGRVAGHAWVFARSATLGGRWGGNVRVHAETLRIVPGTEIAGDLIVTGPKAPVLDPSVVIGGQVVSRPPLLPESQAFPAAATRERFLLHAYLFLAALVAGMPFVGLFPLLAGGAVRSLRLAPWRVLLAGLLAILGGPFLIAFAAMTVLGVPLAILLAAAYLLLAFFSHIVVALWIGHLLLRTSGPSSFGQVLSSLALGLFVLYGGTALPGVSSFVILPVLILGAGAIVTARTPLSIVALPPPPPRSQPQP